MKHLIIHLSAMAIIMTSSCNSASTHSSVTYSYYFPPKDYKLLLDEMQGYWSGEIEYAWRKDSTAPELRQETEVLEYIYEDNNLKGELLYSYNGTLKLPLANKKIFSGKKLPEFLNEEGNTTFQSSFFNSLRNSFKIYMYDDVLERLLMLSYKRENSYWFSGDEIGILSPLSPNELKVDYLRMGIPKIGNCFPNQTIEIANKSIKYNNLITDASGDGVSYTLNRQDNEPAFKAMHGNDIAKRFIDAMSGKWNIKKYSPTGDLTYNCDVETINQYGANAVMALPIEHIERKGERFFFDNFTIPQKGFYPEVTSNELSGIEIRQTNIKEIVVPVQIIAYDKIGNDIVFVLFRSNNIMELREGQISTAIPERATYKCVLKSPNKGPHVMIWNNIYIYKKRWNSSIKDGIKWEFSKDNNIITEYIEKDGNWKLSMVMTKIPSNIQLANESK